MLMEHSALDEHIFNLVQGGNIAEQEILQNLLKDRGITLSQATLSRRLKKLKIAKVGGSYKVTESIFPPVPTVLNIQVSEFGVIVLHTYPGSANSLAYHLDQKYVNLSQEQIKDSGILGIIAGDDTLFLSIRSAKDTPRVLALLQKEFPYLKFP